MEENTSQSISTIPKNKYTTQQVFDSCDWDTKDCDEDVDGNLHIVSGLDGNAITIPLLEILNSVGITKQMILQFKA